MCISFDVASEEHEWGGGGSVDCEQEIPSLSTIVASRDKASVNDVAM